MRCKANVSRQNEGERQHARIPSPVPFPADRLATEDVVDAEGASGRGQQPLQPEPVEPRSHKNQGDQQIGQPGQQLIHADLRVGLHRNGRQPRLLPRLAPLEVPWLLRTKPALPGEDDGEHHRWNRPDERGELRTEKEGQNQVEDVERRRDEQRERKRRNGIAPTAVRPEHPAEEEEHRRDDHKRRSRVSDRRIARERQHDAAIRVGVPTAPKQTGTELQRSATIAAQSGGNPSEMRSGAANAAGEPNPAAPSMNAPKA